MAITEYPLLEAGVNGDMWGRTDGVYAAMRVQQTAEHMLVTTDQLNGEPVGYAYNADTYCAGCILFTVNYLATKVEISHRPFTKPSVKKTLTQWAAHLGINMADETSYDSDTWPKIITEKMITRPETCGRCAAFFGMNPNEAAWCFECEGFASDCGHPGTSGTEFPEYRAWCENGDLHGYAQVQQLRSNGLFHVELWGEDRTLALAAGYGEKAEDFPIEEDYDGELRAHRRARTFAEDLVKQAIEHDKAEYGEDADEDAHHVQCTDGAFLES